MLNAYAKRAAVIGLAAIGLTLFCGCASSGGQSSEKVAVVEGIQGVAKELETAQGEVDQVVNAINQLQTGNDLKAAFGNYNSAIAKLEKAADRVKSRRDKMSAHRDEYIARWQKDLETIQNPDVQAALTERKSKINQNFDRIRSSVEQVRAAYNPLMRDLKETQTALSLDLNTEGVTALKPAFQRASADAAALKKSIASLQAELQSIAGSMTPPPAPK